MDDYADVTHDQHGARSALLAATCQLLETERFVSWRRPWIQKFRQLETPACHREHHALQHVPRYVFEVDMWHVRSGSADCNLHIRIAIHVT